ncbi:MAG TPA: OmpA family protein [Thermoanaerobaculia bacterium]|nr:OmpA family protein [Thermoanaerobaculia bacterium]
MAGNAGLGACGLVLALAACGGGGETTAAPAAGRQPRATSAGEPAAAWVDPEPPGAQALAEAVLAAEWNADKTTRLAMHITTLVDTTTGIEGFQSTVAGADTSLAGRLSRLGAEETATEVTIRLPGAVLFDFDSAALRLDAERTLAEVAEVLAAYGTRPARIEGHTDSIASEEYNQRLSLERAESVRSWLAAHGVAAGRLATVGHGESRPVADNATAAGRQQNRRVEIVVEKGGG